MKERLFLTFPLLLNPGFAARLPTCPFDYKASQAARNHQLRLLDRDSALVATEKSYAAMRHGATVLATLDCWDRTVAPRNSLGRERMESTIKDKEDKEKQGQRQRKLQKRGQ